jgi:hypothetical protein
MLNLLVRKVGFKRTTNDEQGLAMVKQATDSISQGVYGHITF